MAADVPAHISHQPATIQNGALVQTGTNWDFSRGAVATPIVVLPDPVPVLPIEAPAPMFTQYLAADKVPANPPLVVVPFTAVHIVVLPQARAELAQLDKTTKYVVVGHADAAEKNPELLSRQRANAVAAQMRHQGFKVAAVKSFGDRRPLATSRSRADVNRRVDVIAVE